MYRWQSLLGKFQFEKEKITFVGETTKFPDQPGAAVGNAISDQRFSDGVISGTVRFSSVSEYSACQFIISYLPAIGAFITAGIGNEAMFVVRSFIGRWIVYGAIGDRTNLESDRDYEVKVQVMGSRVTLTVDGVDVIMKNLPLVLPYNQVGFWCQDTQNITISGFKVETQQPTAFVVMQFTKPYNELYMEVIQPICEEFHFTALRADESYRQGLIIADITKQIMEAKLVIVEITPPNPNVFYELGFAHAINKPTILIAEQGTQLPFDVSPFRVLFYENSIDGKRRVEEGFRKHLEALMQEIGLEAKR